MAIKQKTEKMHPHHIVRPKKISRPSSGESALAANPPENVSELGRKLLTIRRKIEESGIPLLTDEEIAKEKAERRGGFYSN